MLKSNEELYNHISNLNKTGLRDAEFSSKLSMIEAQYGVPVAISHKILAGSCYPGEYDNFVLFAIMSIIDEKSIKKFFTEKEIDFYDTNQYNVKKLKFPIKLTMIECSDDQWIGVIPAKEIIAWRNAQIINYNENTQRTLKKVMDGGIESYRIAVNKKQVNDISHAMRENKYIPDTLTLNMPEGTDFDYNGTELIIKQISAFDIVDGYHRYLAISDCFNAGISLKINIEIRITAFDTEKARQFIWQEDQKVHMEKMESNSYNSNSDCNIITSMLNSNGILSNKIGAKGLVKQGNISKVIDIVFCSDTKKRTRSTLLSIARKISSRIEELDPVYLEKNWDNETLIAIMLYCNDEIDDVQDAINGEIINDKHLTTLTINQIRKRLEV